MVSEFSQEAGAGIGRPTRRRLPALLGLAAGGLLLLVGLDRLAVFGADRWAISKVQGEAAFAADIRVTALRSEIEKQRTLPVVLAQDPDVRTALEQGDASAIAALDAKFKTLAAATRAGVIYLMTDSGLCISASNAGTPLSFVGSDYGFRPYFQRALAEGSAEHFAFGTVSLHPGLYLARRVDAADGRPLGVVVVKAEFDDIESDWRRLPLPTPTFVTDTRSIVLVTSEPAWRFRALAPIAEDQKAAIRASLQFGDAPLEPLAFHSAADRDHVVRASLPGTAAPRSFVEARAEVPTTSWTLHVLVPTAPAVNLAATAGRSVALLAGIVGLGAGGLLVARRSQRQREKARQREARRELEEQVETRTAELKAANGQLKAEMVERRRARIALEALQDELAQATKLAMLGQIAASIAHEVNQPVAAIRVFADNARTFLEQGQPDAAGDNLGTIAALTERIGAITQELRAFARKPAREIGPVPVAAAVKGVLGLMGYRLREHNIALALDIPETLVARADRGRLEQVLVNLLQNAIEALADRPDRRLRILAARAGGAITLTIADNGPGLTPEVMAALFLPFTTTKPHGLGLGLVICQDILREFGGSLAAENADGARFIITLPEAA
ncbi:ATP-binding protein [Xanthobacter sp. V4C-4]|uniref:sensor histidine kinase n=1 Tax=Xanthobacter cornucopiae TaxID=3119924 RepID=UPI0037271D07